MYPIEKYIFKTYNRNNPDGSKSTVVAAITTYCGKVVRATAKCTQGDEFSLEKGKELAAARCDLKVCVKRMNRANKKRHEASLNVEEASRKFDKMNKYYSDATTEAFEASQRLHKIEESLM